jgi:hypothetical protein
LNQIAAHAGRVVAGGSHHPALKLVSGHLDLSSGTPEAKRVPRREDS